MNLLEVVLFLLLLSVALGWVARRLNFPYPIALVIGGAALGFLPELPQFPFDPQLILVLVLPPILYQAALLTSWRDFRANIRPIGLLAIGLVIATTLAVGAALKLVVPEIPWAAAFVLGAIVSPPDAVAATAILTRLNVPRRVVTILEGESLVNDASGLVLYKFAVAAVMTGAFSLREASFEFVGVAIGGAIIGVVLGRFFIFIHRYLGDVFIEVLMTLAVPYVSYILAESLYLSGVLAVVAAGLVRGRYAPEIVSAEMRIIARSVWNLLVFLLNSLVFILIGLQLSGILGRLTGYSAGELLLYGTLISAVAIAARFAWVYPATYLPRMVSARLRERDPAPSEAEVFIMSWCGMRGIVSLAAALALPLTLEGGAPFPGRDLIIFLTFVVIAVTLVLQGFSLALLIRVLHVGTDWSEHEEEQRARFALGKAAIAAIDGLAAKEGIA
ncbi:MAG: Na+/H+ antiporter, partial [Burkholderiales bacterium]